MKTRICLILLSISFLLRIHQSISQRPDYTLLPVALPHQKNRGFWWSSSAPLTKAVNELTPEIIPDVELILHHAERVENAVMKALNSREERPDDIVRPCHRQLSIKWRSSIMRRFGFIGLIQPATNCASEVNGVHMEPSDEPGYTLDDLYEAVFHRYEAMQNRLRQITDRVIDNFTTPHVPFNFTYNTASVQCTQSPICLFRQEEHWYTELALHIVGKHEHVIDGQDISLLEFVRVVDHRLGDNLQLWMPVYDNGTVERVIRNDTTTMIQRWQGAPNPSCFREVLVEINPAVIDAIDKADHSAQQAEDALTSSNLAILLLPLGLNIVPIALFADVSTKMMLLYTIMSDI